MSRILYLSPMSDVPPRDGGSRWVHGVVDMLVTAGHSCTLIGHDFVKTDGRITMHFDVAWRNKPWVILRALLQSGHYAEIKYDSAEWRNIVQNHLQDHQYDAVIISFIWMDKLLNIPGMPALAIFDTQNSEWRLCKGYQNSANPLVRKLGRSAATRLDRAMTELPVNAVLMHIAESDVADHYARRPDMNHIVVTPGIVATPRTVSPDYSVAVKQLLFCGNLSNRLNNDAVDYFASEFWPVLQHTAAFTLAGSNPSRNVRKLRRTLGGPLSPTSVMRSGCSSITVLTSLSYRCPTGPGRRLSCWRPSAMAFRF